MYSSKRQIDVGINIYKKLWINSLLLGVEIQTKLATSFLLALWNSSRKLTK